MLCAEAASSLKALSARRMVISKSQSRDGHIISHCSGTLLNVPRDSKGVIEMEANAV
jgi:hypothetical protein